MGETHLRQGNIVTQVPGRSWQEVIDRSSRTDVPEGLWMRCPRCEAMVYRKLVEQNLNVCTECGYHYRVNAEQRVSQLCDPGSFELRWDDIVPQDLLKFRDLIAYKDRLKSEGRKTGHPDAIVAGTGYIKGRRVALACMDPDFIIASMGSVVGEVLTLTIEHANENDLPLIVVCCSGGARMQESTLSLMQMAKTSAALGRFDRDGGLYIAVLTDPTYGGVSASFAMLGDVILAEPGARIGFAGPIVIANTVKCELPEGFQTSQFLMEKGFIDRIVERKQLRNEIGRVIDYAGK